jgi:hypothetical protein
VRGQAQLTAAIFGLLNVEQLHTNRLIQEPETGLIGSLQVPVTMSRFAVLTRQAKHVQAGRAESCLAVQLAILAPSTSQSRPSPGRASSQPLLDAHEASDYSVSF